MSNICTIKWSRRVSVYFLIQMRQMYLKGLKCIRVRYLNNKSHLLPSGSVLDCTGPEGRRTPCKQVLGLDQKENAVSEVRITGSLQCSVPGLCELDVSSLVTTWVFCQAKPALSVLKKMGRRREIIHFAFFPRFEECFCRTAVVLSTPVLGWHITAQGSLGIADTY